MYTSLFLQTLLIQLVSPPPVYQQDVPRLVFVPMFNVLNSDWLMQQEMQIWKFQMNYTLQITSQRKLEMGKEIRDKQQQFLNNTRFLIQYFHLTNSLFIKDGFMSFSSLLRSWHE